MAKKHKAPTAKSSAAKSKTSSAVAKRPGRVSKKPAVPQKSPAARKSPATSKSAPTAKSRATALAPAKPAKASVKPATAVSKLPEPGSKRNGELQEFRELLLALRARVRGDVEQMTSEALDRNGEGTESKSPTHLAELGTETYEQDFALRRVENEHELLSEINEALSRIDKGTFGQCLSCLEAGVTPGKAMIPRARLRVIPYARNCVECERKRERWG